MKTRFEWLAAAGLACALLAAGPVRAAEPLVVTGKQWTSASTEQKKAFLIGAVSVVNVEHQFQGDKLPKGRKSVIPTLHQGLAQMTFPQLEQAIDAYYAGKPDALGTPVLHVMWDIALANTKAQ